MANHPPIVAIIGKSDAGKTTLIEKLIVELRRRNYRVGTLKHHFHTDQTLDRPGKDTWRHAQAGAERVVLISPLTTVTFDYHAQPLTPQEIVAQMPGFDLVLAEGFSLSGLPAIEVSRAERGQELIGLPEYLLAIAADYPLETTVPVFGLDDATGLVDLIERELLV